MNIIAIFNMKSLLYVMVFLPSLLVSSNYSRRDVEFKLHTILNFIDTRYTEFHFDALLGITLAHACLQNTLTYPITSNSRRNVISLSDKCQMIYNKIYPLLPDNPKYMITFRNKLLDVNGWRNIMSNKFVLHGIDYLGYYKNWTTETITGNKMASYKGIKSDVCLREILELSKSNRNCYISTICREMMLDENRIDSGYLLTHRLLYLLVTKLQNCKLPDNFVSIDIYTKRYCSFIFKEAVTSEMLGYPYHDIFLEQVVLCGLEGYAEFLDQRWLNEILSWQNPFGCYESMQRNVTKRTTFTIDFGCSDHTTGLAAAVLALHLRFIDWPNVMDRKFQ
ncbi:hypothetical protein NQ318_022301 [Aromia moschata]|uniref:Uncharacterized protein n=1 Tax=Aromia moschata TaxID=1265417 RepID=A0AAV8Z4U5_9CUCU|nr:hypothetical protein NQ318_022301 [Aromia moschata]